MSVPRTLAHARHAFFRLAGPLPLGNRGAALKRALRQTAGAAGITSLVRAWRGALDRLHQAGFGTDDALGHALHDDDVVFAPEGVFPLGTTTAKRPVASWLDLEDARRWLTDQGASPDVLSIMASAPPWPGYPSAPAGLFALLGPPDECHALCVAAGIPTVSAQALGLATRRARPASSQGGLLALAQLRRIPTPLNAGRPVAVLAGPAGMTMLPVFCAARFALGGRIAGVPDDDGVAADVFGLEYTLIPADLARGEGRSRRGTAGDHGRALEDARLLETDAERAAAEANALFEALLDAAEARPTEAEPGRIGRIIDRAREGLDRELSQNAILLRALVTGLVDPRRAMADLTEVRRLGGRAGAKPSSQAAPRGAQSGSERLAGVARAVHRCVLHLAGTEPGPELAGASGSLLSDALSELFATSPWTFEDDHRALTLAGLIGLDLPELGPFLHESALGLVVERLGHEAILQAREEHTERLLLKLVATTVLPAAVRDLALAWTSVCAARRDARASVRERLLSASHALLAPTPEAPLAPASRLAAERYALAARLVALDGLVAPWLDVAALEGPLTEDLRKRAALHRQPNLPAWLATVALDLLLESDESERRRHWPALAASVPPLPGPDRALGAVLSAFDSGRAKELLKRTAHGEPHHERRALGWLQKIPGTTADEQAAIARRLESLGPSRSDNPWEVDELVAPPLSPEAAEARVVQLLDALVAAAVGGCELESQPDGPAAAWSRAVCALLGTPLDVVPGATSASGGLAIIEAEPGTWLLETTSGTDGERACRFTGRGNEVARSSPELTSRVLSRLAPLFTLVRPESTSATPYPTADALDDVLSSGDEDFMANVLPAFKRRELTLATLRGAVHLGLTATRGLYRGLADRWNIEDYQRFMDFLRRNDALLDYRPYRRPQR